MDNSIISKVEQDFDLLQSRLRQAIPIIDVLKKRDWEKLKNTIVCRLKSIKDSSKLNNEIFIEYAFSCFCSNLRVSSEFEHFIKLMNILFKDVLNCSKKYNHETTIKNKIREVFMNRENDLNTQNSSFKNTVNELILYKYLVECNNVANIEIEKQLSNGKCIDFIVTHKDGTTLAIEVETIHNVDVKKQETSDSMRLFLKNKAAKKREDKLCNSTCQDKFDDFVIVLFLELKNEESINEQIFSFNPIEDPKTFVVSSCVVEYLTLISINEYIKHINYDC
ncbi:MAG: hypothetical protein ACI30M_08210 [Muribaculaceae bacterium]